MLKILCLRVKLWEDALPLAHFLLCVLHFPSVSVSVFVL